jgi:hypothetical protein
VSPTESETRQTDQGRLTTDLLSSFIEVPTAGASLKKAGTWPKPLLIDGFLPERTFRVIRAYVDRLAENSRGPAPMESEFKRDFAHNAPLLVQVHAQLVPLVSELVGRPVKKTYVFAAMYRGGAVCPPHQDREQCKYTMDLCVSQREPWGLYVDGVEYLLNENDALLFAGLENEHWRDQLEPEGFCNVVLFHFVDEDFEGPLD